MAGKSILDINELGIDFGGLHALDEFSLNIQPGEIVGLIGPNGAGKTTVFNLLTNVYAPTRGHIRLMGPLMGRLASASRTCSYFSSLAMTTVSG